MRKSTHHRIVLGTLGTLFTNALIIIYIGGIISAAEIKFQIKSSAFNQGQAIPSKYTCDGQDISPPLEWTEPLPGTKSLALMADDPDAPKGTWVHWIVYNLPPSARRLQEGFGADAQLPDGTMQGKNDFGRTGYGGPCPPSGMHRYFFKLFALDRTLSLAPGATAKELEKAMQDHILTKAELMGTYRSKSR